MLCTSFCLFCLFQLLLLTTVLSLSQFLFVCIVSSSDNKDLFAGVVLIVFALSGAEPQLARGGLRVIFDINFEKGLWGFEKGLWGFKKGLWRVRKGAFLFGVPTSLFFFKKKSLSTVQLLTSQQW
jgi:hypothetical protein